MTLPHQHLRPQHSCSLALRSPCAALGALGSASWHSPWSPKPALAHPSARALQQQLVLQPLLIHRLLVTSVLQFARARARFLCALAIPERRVHLLDCGPHCRGCGRTHAARTLKDEHAALRLDWTRKLPDAASLPPSCHDHDACCNLLPNDPSQRGGVLHRCRSVSPPAGWEIRAAAGRDGGFRLPETRIADALRSHQLAGITRTSRFILPVLQYNTSRAVTGASGIVTPARLFVP
jgi:hypothetical protein